MTVRPADEDVEAVRARLERAIDTARWTTFMEDNIEGRQQARADLASLSARLDEAVEGQAAAEQRAADAEKALRQIEDTSPNWMQAAAEADCCSRMREIASNALASARAGEATEQPVQICASCGLDLEPGETHTWYDEVGCVASGEATEEKEPAT